MVQNYKIIIGIVCIYITLCTQLWAQENSANHWFFGINCGVSFATGVPKGIIGGQITGFEGCATVGDLEGNLLFYTDGQVIYDRYHNVMQNGTGLLGHWSSTQSSIIIKRPGTEKEYYVFTLDASENHLENGWRYSIVDMNLNGGLGAVTDTKNMLLENSMCEKQTAIMHINNVNVWIVGHRWDSDEFVAYEITAEGINPTPVVSAIGTVHAGGSSPTPNLNGWTNTVGVMKTNMEGDKLALSIQKMGIFELFDFDKASGIVSNCHTSAVYDPVYGVEFSPDGTKLYTTCNIYGLSRLYQFDITQDNPFSNPILIASSSPQRVSGMQIGPNGKIYVVQHTGGYLGEINYPNETGANCQYVANAVFLQGESGQRGLPSIFFYKGFQFFTGSEVNVSICDGDSIFLQNAYRYSEGIFIDTLTSSLGWDSIVTTYLGILPAPPEPTITETNGVLYSTLANYYQWYLNGNQIAGASSQMYQPFVSGTFTVEVFEDPQFCHRFSDEYPFVYNSISEFNTANLNMYPNPCYNTLYTEINETYDVTIRNIIGEIYYKQCNVYGIIHHDCSCLPCGLYMVEIRTNKTSVYKKLLKQ